MKTLYTFSMQRSGQHGVLNWLTEQNKPSIHYNHCRLVGSLPKPKNYVFEFQPNKERVVHPYRKFQPRGNYKLRIYSFEDQKIIPGLGGKKIVIIRDPWNWKASRYKLGWTKLYNENMMWKAHMRSKLYKIFFNEWFVNKEYRKKICEDLGLEFTDEGLENMYNQQTSSFDGMSFKGKAQEMGVLNRWKRYEKDEKFMKSIEPEMIQLWEDRTI